VGAAKFGIALIMKKQYIKSLYSGVDAEADRVSEIKRMGTPI